MTYIDDYPTCDRTYATLCIYTGDTDPTKVTELLGITPSRVLFKDDQFIGTKRRTPLNGWFLSSKEIIESLDSRCHIDWLLNQLDEKEDAVKDLLQIIDRATVSCYWSSKSGHGGPTLSRRQMEGLLKYSLELWFDFY